MSQATQPDSDEPKSTHVFGGLLPIEQIPEIPEHQLYRTHQYDEHIPYPLYVTTDHEKIYDETSFRHLIVECGLCGHCSFDSGIMANHAWCDQDMHMAMKHIGVKLVWRREDIPTEDEKKLFDTPRSVRESRYDEPDNEWDGYLRSISGEYSDTRAVTSARDSLVSKWREEGLSNSEIHRLLQDTEFCIEHHPPSHPVPAGVEFGARKGLRIDVKPEPRTENQERLYHWRERRKRAKEASDVAQEEMK